MAASSASKKIVKALEGVSLGSIVRVLDGIATNFSEEERIPEGSRHTRLLEIGGKLRKRGVRGYTVEAVLRWLNDNLCEPPLEGWDVDGIVASVLNIQMRINALVDAYEAWIEGQGHNPLFAGMAGATNEKLLKTLSRRVPEARLRGKRRPRRRHGEAGDRRTLRGELQDDLRGGEEDPAAEIGPGPRPHQRLDDHDPLPERDAGRR